MTSYSAGPQIDRLIQLLGKLPGLVPRSARRAALALLKRKADLLEPLSAALTEAGRAIKTCAVCGNLDTADPCTLCQDPRREQGMICVVEEVGDLWAIERAGIFRGRYHVLGGSLSALDGRGPDSLSIGKLVGRAASGGIAEVVLALNATVDGQATAHYVAERMHELNVPVTRLAHGLPVGGELGYLDDGTLNAAFKARRPA
ncbi:MAG: recombination protein RecR [Alphaproteobacteria bacterium]|nr:recombination protein RecR [Alphaproteobacteria bacterium]